MGKNDGFSEIQNVLKYIKYLVAIKKQTMNKNIFLRRWGKRLVHSNGENSQRKNQGWT